MLEGNFLEVERIGRVGLQSAEAKRDADRSITPANTLIEAYTESGDTAAAARVGEEFVGMLALCGQGCVEHLAAAIFAKARGGRLARAQANAQLLGLYEDLAQRKGPASAWRLIYAYNVRSPEDAQVALSVYEHEHPVSDFDSTSLSLASTYALTGHSAEARGIFAKVGGACFLATDTRQMMTEHLLRGRLDEEDGNKPSACAHYAKILERWGHAKPRSVTADEARARSKALGCPP
jgi:serine/threonine-protein kinase